MMKLLLGILLPVGLFVGLVAAANMGWDWGPVVVTREGEQRIVLRLNQAVRVTEPGLSWIVPGIEVTERFDRRWLHLDSEPNAMQTRDGEQLTIDNYAIWRIDDAIAFKRAFPQGQQQAESRLDRAMRDDVREVIGRHTLVEVVDTKRGAVMEEITQKTRDNVAPLGIEVVDVRISRTDLPEKTMASVYARMKTERERLAKKSRAEGEEQARRIRAEADRDARIIVANAVRDAEIAKGEGDAESTRIYAEAFGSDPEFYDFMRSLEAYRKTIDANTTLVLSPKAEFFRYFEGVSPGSGANGARPEPAAAE